MKIRITGTKPECKKFVAMCVKAIPAGYLRNISDFYPNTRKNMYSNEGRVYIDLEIPRDDRELIE